ncbi:hypothetical protein [Chitinimonas sp.]|uniref:hypothetical protein n=1 Tax=Chitinimonas sp. TaxID=1934313 RepID=UPI0035AE3517
MPIFLGLGLHVLIAIYFAIHALRNGYELYWLIVLFSFPMLGSIVYFVVIYWPSLRHSRGTQVAKRVIRQAIDPGRALREAKQAFELTPTVGNRAALAAALLDSGDARAAQEHYRACLSGPFASDINLVAGFVRASLALGEAGQASAALDQLFAQNKQARQQEQLALLHARTLAAQQSSDARAAFEQALTVSGDAEATCRYADWLDSQNNDADHQRARELYEQIISDSRHWHRHAKSNNNEWLNRAKGALAKAA